MDKIKCQKAFNSLLLFAEEMVRRYPNSPWIYKDGNKIIKEAKEISDSLNYDLKRCWNCGCKKEISGFATIKKNSKLIFAGHRLKILGVNHILKDGLGFLPDNTKFFKLCLKETEFKNKFGEDFAIISEIAIEKFEIDSKLNINP